MTLRTLVLKASVDLPTSNQKRGNAQDVAIGQKLTRMITLSYQESVELARAKEYANPLATVQHQHHEESAVIAYREVPQTPADLIREAILAVLTYREVP